MEIAKGKSPLIVVKLSNYDAKISILNAKVKKTVRVSDIAECDPSIANNYVYINNHVTLYFGLLLKEGRTAIKNGQIHSCWLAFSGCMLKFEKEGNSIGFNSLEELKNVIESRATTNQTANASIKRGRSKEASPSNNNHNNKQRRPNMK